MAILAHLDTFYPADRIVSPQMVFNKRTMEPMIYVQVTGSKSGAIIETKIVMDEDAYLEYVDNLIGR
jgi:hypothetical protein